jgi:hypothetical protein
MAFPSTSTTQSSGSSIGLGGTGIEFPKGVQYITVHQVFDMEESKNTGLRNINLEADGKSLRTITGSALSSSSAYSNNPAEIVVDLLMTTLSVSESEIDFVSFQKAKDTCNSNNWSANVIFIQRANIQSIMQDILSTCRGSLVHSDGKWKMKIDSKQQATVASLTNDDFINNSLSISMKGNRDISNKIVVRFVNPDDSWLSAQAVAEDLDLQDIDGQVLEKTLDIKAITNLEQASELAEITLNSMRYSEDASGTRLKQTPLALVFATTVKNAHLEVGDIISINHDILDRMRKFMILSTETDQSGLIQVGCREYCETHYQNSNGSYLI